MTPVLTVLCTEERKAGISCLLNWFSVVVVVGLCNVKNYRSFQCWLLYIMWKIIEKVLKRFWIEYWVVVFSIVEESEQEKCRAISFTQNSPGRRAWVSNIQIILVKIIHLSLLQPIVEQVLSDSLHYHTEIFFIITLK